ncbi:MAG: nucleotidyltransferase domain-containing protein [Gemmatimonadales bacterium]
MMMPDVKARVDRFLDELDRVWPAGYAAVLFGSAARGQHIAGWSDINILLVLSAISPEVLRAAGPAFRRWREDAGGPPLLFTEAEWGRSADAYPLELAEMNSCYEVLRGIDPLLGQVVRPQDLRAAVERELRGKLMRLRQAWAVAGDDLAQMSELLRRSAGSIMLLCRGLVLLVGEAVPAEPAALVAAAARIAGFPDGAVATVVTNRGDGAWRCTAAQWQDYLASVESMARFVDHYQHGEWA